MKTIFSNHIAFAGPGEEVAAVIYALFNYGGIPEEGFEIHEEATFLAPLVTKDYVPTSYVETLSKHFPNVYFNLDYRATNIFGVCGSYGFINGKTVRHDVLAQDSEKAKETYESLCDDEEEYWKTEDGDIHFWEFSSDTIND